MTLLKAVRKEGGDFFYSADSDLCKVGYLSRSIKIVRRPLW